MMENPRSLLDPAAIEMELAGMAPWRHEEGRLRAEFAFPSYSAGVLFACALAQAAESMDHHPDLEITYRRVAVSVSTHDAGGVTGLDLELARRAIALAG
jgi:4a-hydroxytetrahydrobiopterin dehydratase